MKNSAIKPQTRGQGPAATACGVYHRNGSDCFGWIAFSENASRAPEPMANALLQAKKY
jgi:hypothetical protein